MKKQIFILLATWVPGNFSTLNAQTDPLDQFLLGQIWGNPVLYDSISIRLDSADHNQTVEAYSIYRDGNGNLDSLHAVDVYHNLPFYSYYGEEMGSDSRISQYFHDGGNLYPMNRTTFHGGENHPMKITIESHDSIKYEDMVRFDVVWRNQTQVDRMDMYAAINPGQFFYLATYQYYYHNNQLDSIVTYNQAGSRVELQDIHRDNNGRVSGTDRYERWGGSALVPTVRFRLSYDNNNRFFEAHQYLARLDSTGYDYAQTFRFEKQNGSTIGLKAEITAPKLQLYPNPTTDYVYLDGEIKAGTNFALITMNGSVLKRGLLGGSINVEDLKPGVYLLQLKDQHHSHTLRFVKK